MMRVFGLRLDKRQWERDFGGSENPSRGRASDRRETTNREALAPF
jgi:hypothetical protein